MVQLSGTLVGDPSYVPNRPEVATRKETTSICGGERKGKERKCPGVTEIKRKKKKPKKKTRGVQQRLNAVLWLRIPGRGRAMHPPVLFDAAFVGPKANGASLLTGQIDAALAGFKCLFHFIQPCDTAEAPTDNCFSTPPFGHESVEGVRACIRNLLRR